MAVCTRCVPPRFSLDELDSFAGFVAAEANNTNDKKLQKQFDAISDAIDQLSLSCVELASTETAMKRRPLALVKK